MDTVLEFAESAIFRAPMTDETKKKISEALKKNGGNIAGKVEVMKKGVSDTADAIAKSRAEVASLKAELAKVPKGPAGKAQRQKIAARAKEMLA